jgi:hypothetical protein
VIGDGREEVDRRAREADRLEVCVEDLEKVENDTRREARKKHVAALVDRGACFFEIAC